MGAERTHAPRADRPGRTEPATEPAARTAPARSNQDAQQRALAAAARFAGEAGPGDALPTSIDQALRPQFGAHLDDVRVHTDADAGQAADAIGARAFTVGEHIGFAAGQFDPHSDNGRQLITHELTHVVQQRQAGPVDGPPTLSRPDDQFERAADAASAPGSGGPVGAAGTAPPSVQRQVPDAGGPDAGTPDAGTPDAGGTTQPAAEPGAAGTEPVVVNGISVPADDAGQHALVSQLVHTEGLGTLYQLEEALQAKVRLADDEIAAAHRFAQQVEQYGSPSAGVPWNDQMYVEAQTARDHVEQVRVGFEAQVNDLLARYNAFHQLVLDATAVRLEGNRSALAAWKDYLHTVITPRQLRRQVTVENQRSAVAAALTGPRPSIAMEALDRQSHMTSPRRRQVEDRVARGLISSGCEYCHEVQAAINFEYAHPDLTAPTVTPEQLFQQYALDEWADPTPVPGFMTQRPDVGVTHTDVAGQPGVSSEIASIQSIRPILRQLGPDGFKVIDESLIVAELSDAQLLAALDTAIEVRRANFAEFERRLQEPGFDYMIPRPVFREVLPLADSDVRAIVDAEIARASADSTAGAILMGVATVAALLLTLFPPTAPIGLALDVGLAGYGIYSGIEQYQQGALLSLGIGSTVLDAQQQEAAHGLMAMGALNVVLSSIGVATGGLGAVRMIRSGSGATAVLESVEAEAAGQRITVTQLNTSNPRAVVVDAEGAVVVDQSLEELTLLEGPGTPGGPPGSGGGATPGGGGGSTQNVLVVGAETEAEFAYATDVAQAGQPVTVVNPVATEQSQAFASQGGRFVQAPIEELPPGPAYTMIREDYPFPLGRALPPTAEFAAARIDRLLPGGRWVVATEQAEFATTLEAAASRQGARVTVRQVPLAHEGTPVSGWPRENNRFILIIEKDATAPPVPVTPDVPPPISVEPGGGAAMSSPRLAPGLPDEVLDDTLAALDAEQPFSLNIGARRAQQIESGERDFVLDRPVSYDIDEPLPVGAPDVRRARAVERARDPHNRQLLDPMTNQRTKYLGMSQETVERGRLCLEPVSVTDNPSAILTRRFDEVVELQQVFDQAEAQVQNIRSLGPSAIKARINANIRSIIRDGSTPAGAQIRDALRSLGFEYVPERGFVAVRSVSPPVP